MTKAEEKQVIQLTGRLWEVSQWLMFITVHQLCADQDLSSL
jgi:hypothetical protein